MALSIEDPETERLARSLAQLTGEDITTATERAIEERLRRLAAKPEKLLCWKTWPIGAGMKASHG